VLTMQHLSAIVDINVDDKRRSLSPYSSLADSGHRFFFWGGGGGLANITFAGSSQFHGVRVVDLNACLGRGGHKEQSNLSNSFFPSLQSQHNIVLCT
jgi:hypothetical protein